MPKTPAKEKRFLIESRASYDHGRTWTEWRVMRRYKTKKMRNLNLRSLVRSLPDDAWPRKNQSEYRPAPEASDV